MRMRKSQALLLMALAGVAMVGSAASGPKAGGQPGFAVVELYTSEGCSSCPPADELVSDLVRDADAQGTAVYPLAFHVDYWNRLGWVDKLSDAAYSRRQSVYAEATASHEVYTPQMIINGQGGFIGSDRDEAARQIAAALRQSPAAALKLTASPDAHGLVVHYELDKTIGDATINVAIVERGITTRVMRGENGGRTLRHENAVRVFATNDLSGTSGDVKLEADDQLLHRNLRLIAFVQAKKGLAIVAATQAALPPRDQNKTEKSKP